MIWIIALGCFLVGAAVGALLFRVFHSNEARIRELEQQLQQITEEHQNYKSSVNTHFGTTARLFSQLTGTYREVYQHLAEGACQLCPDYISNQLTFDNESKVLLSRDEPVAHQSETAAPPIDVRTEEAPAAETPAASETQAPDAQPAEAQSDNR
ncbi:MAG: YhcB family protein [Pseudomonadales bacterium]|jgi:uncharacterized membrane-anchored protein YhcB (DUF1043 family)|nr:YhcB family protein [Pseudomonadales bacterium]